MFLWKFVKGSLRHILDATNASENVTILSDTGSIALRDQSFGHQLSNSRCRYVTQCWHNFHVVPVPYFLFTSQLCVSSPSHDRKRDWDSQKTDSQLSARLRGRGRMRERVAAIASSTPGPESVEMSGCQSQELSLLLTSSSSKEYGGQPTAWGQACGFVASVWEILQLSPGENNANIFIYHNIILILTRRISVKFIYMKHL